MKQLLVFFLLLMGMLSAQIYAQNLPLTINHPVMAEGDAAPEDEEEPDCE